MSFLNSMNINTDSHSVGLERGLEVSTVSCLEEICCQGIQHMEKNDLLHGPLFLVSCLPVYLFICLFIMNVSKRCRICGELTLSGHCWATFSMGRCNFDL